MMDDAVLAPPTAAEQTIEPERGTPPSPRRMLIEVGVIVAGKLDSIDAKAARNAVEAADARLKELYPEFKFDFFEIKRPEMAHGGRVEPSLLLRQAVEERDAKHWDFAFVLTGAELIGNYSPYCFAALSRPLDAAVISMSLIDPQALGVEVDQDTRVARITRRLCRLILHGFGHLSGLPKSDQPTDLLYHPPDARSLDHMWNIDPEMLQRQRDVLQKIADPRLEEASRRMSYPGFVLGSIGLNLGTIARAVMAARPWEFPRRLSRLTIAAFSTLAILLMTAEAWDLALAQRPGHVTGLIGLSLLVTTIYVVVRQQLLVRRRRRRSEQSVVTSVSALGIVMAGMAFTWLSLFAVGLILSYLLFPGELIATWAASTISDSRHLVALDRPHMAMFSASLGLLIGALGASFESQDYFGHIIFVDEEI